MLDFTYCESSEFYFTAQPLNTFSSAAFFLAAFFLYRTFCPGIYSGHKRWQRVCPMVILCVLIGIGSILWHSVQKKWALVADVAPIFIFLFVFQYIFLKKFTDWPQRRIVLDMAGLLAAMGLASLVMNDIFLQKSNVFVPVAFWLIYAGVEVGQRFPRQARLCFLAAPVFALAIVMRILDMPLCSGIPEGTHFLWHSLSALALYLVVLCFKPVTRRQR